MPPFPRRARSPAPSSSTSLLHHPPPFRNASSFSSVLYVTSTYGPDASRWPADDRRRVPPCRRRRVTSSRTASLFIVRYHTSLGRRAGRAGVSAAIGFLTVLIVVRPDPKLPGQLARSSCSRGLNIGSPQTITNQVSARTSHPAGFIGPGRVSAAQSADFWIVAATRPYLVRTSPGGPCVSCREHDPAELKPCRVEIGLDTWLVMVWVSAMFRPGA